MEDNKKFNPGNTDLRITDASSMLRSPIDANERPFKKHAIKANNALVDEWHNSVLVKICDANGSIKAGQVEFEWQYFYTGKTIPQFISHLEKGLILRASKETINYWVNIFETYSSVKLASLGTPVVGCGWKLLIGEAHIRDCEEKWEKIYKHSNDPLKWRKDANNYPKLWNQDKSIVPFWENKKFEEIAQKVLSILQTPIQPVH